MSRHLFPALLLVLLTACAAPTYPPPPGVAANVAAPALNVGDAWRYAVQDGYTHLPRGSVDYRVTRIDGDTATVEVRSEDRVATELYTRAGNWLRRPATNMQDFSYSPPYEAFAFPLAVGKTWKARSIATDPADGRSFPVTIQGAVLSWQRVRVPAGEFDALKVRRHVYLDYWRQTVRGQSIIEEVEWYAPAVNRVVRREASSRYLSYIYGERAGAVMRVGGMDDGGGPRYIPDEWLVYELVSYGTL